MKYVAIALLLIVCQSTFAQKKWHVASYKLKLPKNNTGYYVTVAYFNRYDTVPCIYITKNSEQQLNGYKLVYFRDGYYTDDHRTWKVFFNDHLQRIYNVERYCLK